MKLTLRSLFAVLAAALAFACADAGSGAGTAGGASSIARQREMERGQMVPSSPARLLLRGGARLVLDGPGRATGTPPRLAAGGDPFPDTQHAAYTAARRASGARTRRLRTLALARQLAAARDGTVSSHSNGVPPPPFA